MKIKELIKEVISEPDKLDQLEQPDYDKFIKYLQDSYYNKNIH